MANSNVTVQPPETIHQAINKTAIKSPNHLKQWLNASGRRFIIMKSDELVDALPWPEGVETLIHLIECYRQFRCARVVEVQPCPKCQGRAPAVKGCPKCGGHGVHNRLGADTLEPAELKEVVQHLTEQIRVTDPKWSP